MKSLQKGNSTNPEWDSRLVQDLSFIKKNLRYRVGKKAILPAALLSVSLFILVMVIYMIFLSSEKKLMSGIVPILILATVIAINVKRYFDTLKFQAILTGFSADQNIRILEDFLNARHLLIYRHPEAKEVFQIVSKNLNAFKNEEREVIVFIADDNRILINSHFSGASIGGQAYRHHLQMAEDLWQWIHNTRHSNNY